MNAILILEMTGGHDVLGEARKKREALHQAMIDLEAAYTAPWQAEGWKSNLAAGLKAVRRALADHAEEVESPDGIISGVLRDAPRLAAAAETLVKEHSMMMDKADQATGLVEALASPLDARAVAEAGESVFELLGMISHHRQRGASLVYEAYLVDIGHM